MGRMSLEELRRAIAALDERASCAGVVAVDGRLTITLPSGEAAAVDDPRFVDWLVAHAEPAPFGDMVDRATKVDPAVRAALRLTARGAARVEGFDPASVLPEVEAALSPRAHLTARLTDLVVYPVGGHFAAHKDTPHAPDLVGTLVVGLPIAHEGGALRVGGETVDWSGPVAPGELRWVALFSDADHAVAPVTAGARVTLVYALHQTEREREGSGARMEEVARALTDLELPTSGPLVIPCAREVIGVDGPQPLPLSSLRGVDRELAETLRAHGFEVTVRACLAARQVEDFPPESTAWDITAQDLFFATLRRPFTDEDAAALLDAVTFVPACCDGGGYLDDETSDLSDRVDEVPAENWLLRPGSIATFIAKRDFSSYGLVGNDAPESFLYKLAALEVRRRASAADP